MQTSELTGAALDWAVAMCECVTLDYGLTDDERYSTNWAQGGPIIERERICVSIGHDGVWLAYSMQNYEDRKEFMHIGPTPLIAAMRCYCSAKFGDEVDIPEELNQ